MKKAFFVGGDADGALQELEEHPKFIDIDKTVGILTAKGEQDPTMTKQRYFLAPNEILVEGEPHALYIIQGWNMTDVAEYLLMLFITVINSGEGEECMEMPPPKM